MATGETLSGNDNRNVSRDSLFLMADLHVDGVDGEWRIKVRNLSDGGMMGEGPVRIARGALVDVHLRNIGWVEGSVAWIQGDRFGIAFREEIDAKLARLQATPSQDSKNNAPRYTRSSAPRDQVQPGLRKI